LFDTNPRRDATEYLQAAGDAKRLTVEMRRLVGETFEQLVVGRAPSGNDERQRVTVRWSDFEVVVRGNETFDAVEAARIFTAYYETHDIPPGSTLRQINL
jgi:hypothetical protein